MTRSSAGWSGALCSCAAWLVVGCAQSTEPAPIAPAVQALPAALALALPEPLLEGRSSPAIAVRWSGAAEAEITNTVNDAISVTLMTTSAGSSGALRSLNVGTYQVAGRDSQRVGIGSGQVPNTGDNIPVTLVAIYQVEGNTRRAFSDIRYLTGGGAGPVFSNARGTSAQYASAPAAQTPEEIVSFASRGGSASDVVAPVFSVGKAGPP